MQNAEGANSPNDTRPILVARDIVKSYDDTVILKGISLEIGAGDLVSIIGLSGCGKSTFLRCLNLLEIPDSGTVTIDGISVILTGQDRRWDGAMAAQARALRARIGMVFQSFNLFPHRTLLDNVMLAPLIVKGEPRIAAEQRAFDLSKVRLSDFAGRYPVKCPAGSNSGPLSRGRWRWRPK